MPGAPDEVTIPPEARNQVLLQKVAQFLKTQRLIIPEDKQAMIDLGSALMSGELSVARQAVESLGSHIARLIYIRDSLSGILVHLGVSAVSILPGQAFQAQIAGSKPVEAVYVTLRCNRTGESIGVPSHPGINTQVFKLLSTGDGAGLMQVDDKADHFVVFRRLSAMVAHANTSAPPPWANF